MASASAPSDLGLSSDDDASLDDALAVSPGGRYDDTVSAASGASSPTLSLPESFANLGEIRLRNRGTPIRGGGGGKYLEAGLRRQLEEELAACHERRAAEREAFSERIEGSRLESEARGRRCEQLSAELARARATLSERRDAIDNGFADGLAYAGRADGGPPETPASSATRALVDELTQRPLEELTLRELATVRVVMASAHAHDARARTARAAADADAERVAVAKRLGNLESEYASLEHGASQREAMLKHDVERLTRELES